MTLYPSRRTVAAVLAALVAAALPAAALAQGGPMLELSLATADMNINPTTDSVLKLADRLGFYEKHGVKVTIVTLEGTPQAIAALNARAVDLADIGIDSAIRLRADNGLAIRGIVSGTLGAPFLIAAKTEIATLEGLVGRSYAVADNGSLDHTLSQLVLASKGVAPDGPHYVPIGAPAARVQALAAGRIDATAVSYGTFLPIANTPGIHVLVDPATFSRATPGISKFVAALDSTIAAKGEAIQRFTDALIDASRAFEADPASWVDAMAAARDDLSRHNLEETAKFLAGRWCVNGCMNGAELKKTRDFIYANPDFKQVKSIGLDEIVDTRFVGKSLATLGAFAGAVLDMP